MERCLWNPGRSCLNWLGHGCTLISVCVVYTSIWNYVHSVHMQTWANHLPFYWGEGVSSDLSWKIPFIGCRTCCGVPWQTKAFVVILELFNDSVVLFIFFPTIWHNVLMILMWPVGGPCRIHPICRVPSSAKSTLSLAVVVSLILFQRIKTNWPQLLHWGDTWLDTRRGICFCILSNAL